MSRKAPSNPPRFFTFGSSAIACLSPVCGSEAVEVVLFLLPEFLAAGEVPLPPRDLRHHMREEPERVHGWKDGYAHQIAERHHHEDRFQLVPHLYRVPGELVARQTVGEAGEALADSRPP